MKTTRKRTNEEILSGLGCNMTEAAQVLNVSWETMRELCEVGKVHSFEVGSRTKVSVPSLKRFAMGEAA